MYPKAKGKAKAEAKAKEDKRIQDYKKIII